MKVILNFEYAYIVIGEIYYNPSDLHEALEYFNQAIKINPKLAQAYLDRSNTKKELGEPSWRE